MSIILVDELQLSLRMCEAAVLYSSYLAGFPQLTRLRPADSLKPVTVARLSVGLDTFCIHVPTYLGRERYLKLGGWRLCVCLPVAFYHRPYGAPIAAWTDLGLQQGLQLGGSEGC